MTAWFLTAALLAGGSVAGVLGLLIERLALRPLPVSADPHIRMVSTIGVAVVIQQVVTRIFSARQHPYPTPEVLAGRVTMGPIQFDLVSLFILMSTRGCERDVDKGEQCENESLNCAEEQFKEEEDNRKEDRDDGYLDRAGHRVHHAEKDFAGEDVAEETR